jgi:arylsulfatase A-like enzyme
MAGRSLLPLVRGQGEGRRYVHATARAENDRWLDRGYLLDPRRRLRSVRSERWKLVHYPGAEEDFVELYDLVADPGEKHDVAGAHPQVRARFAEVLREWYDAGSPPEAPDLPDEIRKGLEALGYVE